MTGQDPFSISVQMMTYSDISHCGVILPPQGTDKEEMVIHAAGRGVKYEPRRKLVDKYHFKDIAEYEILPEISDGVIFLLKQVGKRYDNEEIISRVVLRVFQVASPWVTKSAMPSPNQWTCARLVMALDQTRSRLPEWRALDPDGVTPVELLNATSGGPNFRRIR